MDIIQVLVFVILAFTVECQRPREERVTNCPWECMCSQDIANKNMGTGILVNCTGRRLKRFPYPMPSTTTKLILSKNRISSISANDFKAIQHLRILNMEGNRLKKLSVDSFGHLPWLSTLNLRRNRISELQFGFLGNAPNIKVLILAENKISELKYGSFDIVDKLEFLDLSRNNISRVQDGSFLGLKRLKTLFLNDNRLTKVSSQLFPDVYSLKSLHLDRNQIKWVQPESFLRHRYLEVLSLGDNRISHVTYSMLTGLKMLKELYLQRNQITKIDPWSLTQLKNLETLYLYSNFLDEITPNVFVGLGKLRFLHLGMNNIKYIANDAFVDLRILVTLSLDSNRITTLSPRTFSGLRQLMDLQLYFNNISFVAKDSFSELIKLSRLVWDVPAFFKGQRQYADEVGNSLHCDCNVLWLKDWLRRNKKARITCQSPPALKGLPLISLNHADTKCEPISVKVSPKKLLTLEGDDAVLNCTVKPGATYLWTLNGTAVKLDSYHTVNPLGTLTIKAVSRKDIGQYVCIAENAAGVAADAADLSLGARPSFTILPDALDLDEPLEPVIFKCSARGIPTPTITWLKDNLEIRVATEDSQFHITSEGALVFVGKRHHITREGNLIIVNPREEDEGSYTCVAQNSLGKESYSINLYVDMSSKCLYGCNTGGVCRPSQYQCICTQGFHKQGNQCIQDVIPTTSAPLSGSGSGIGSGSGVPPTSDTFTAIISGEGPVDESGDGGSGATPAPSTTKKPPIDQEQSGDESGSGTTPSPPFVTKPPIDQEQSGDDGSGATLTPFTNSPPIDQEQSGESGSGALPAPFTSSPPIDNKQPGDNPTTHTEQTTQKPTHLPARTEKIVVIDAANTGSGDSDESGSGSSGSGERESSQVVQGLRIGKHKHLPPASSVIGNDNPPLQKPPLS